MNMVLVVCERPEQSNALAECLGILGIEAVPSARDWRLATRALVAHRISLAIIDVDESGDTAEFFDVIRDLSALPIMVRGPVANSDLAISYLERGAVDYCGRNTPPAVLAAKVRAYVRAEQEIATGSGVVFAGELEVDLRNRRVLRGSTEVSLTPLEFRLLSVLAENIGRPCAREHLLERVWGKDFTDCGHYLRVYIGYLRQKLEDDPSRPRLFINERGYGYRLMEAGTADRRVGARTFRLAQG